MNILRKYKIYELTGFIDDNSKEIIKFIESRFEGLKERTKPHYPEDRFWYKGNKLVFYYDKDNDLDVIYYDFWGVLRDKYYLNDTNIESIIQYMFEKYFKLKVIGVRYFTT